MQKLTRTILSISYFALFVFQAYGQVQPCRQGTMADVLGTSCSVGSLVLNFRTPFTGVASFTQNGANNFVQISPSDIGFVPVQANGLSGYKLVLNFVTGPGTDSSFVGSHLVQFGYTPSSAPGFEIREVESQAEATAQAPPQGTSIEDVSDFQVYSNTGFQNTDSFFAIDPSFTFPPEHLTDHTFLTIPSPLSSGGASFDPLTTQISDFVVGTGSGTLTSATFLFRMEAVIPAPPQASLTYTNIDIPGSSGSGASNLNSSGQIVGSYSDSLGTQHGFVTEKRGGFTTIDVPGAVATFPSGINNRGDVVGSFTDLLGTSHGFLLSNGNFSTFDPAGSVFTLAFEINDRGEIVGEYDSADGFVHGFLLADGIFTVIDQGPVADGFQLTEVLGINNRGEIAGDLLDPNLLISFTGRKVFQQLEVPSQGDTAMGGINDQGDTVGIYVDTKHLLHGFLNTSDGFKTLDFPGAARTFALGINASGKIVGQYDNGDGVSHAFLAEPGAPSDPNAGPRAAAGLIADPGKPICSGSELRQPSGSRRDVQPCKVRR